MTEDEARAVYKFVAHAQGFTTTERVAVWVGVLTSPQQSDVSAKDAMDAVRELVAEIEDPRKISPAMVLHRGRAYAKARAPSTVQQLEQRWQIEDRRERRYQCTKEDRAALGRLFEAFAHKGDQKAADKIFATLHRDGLEWGDDA